MSDADWLKYKRLRGKDLPPTVQLSFGEYQQEKTFKNDFYAVTCVYRRSTGAGPERVVLKEYHTDPWGVLPLGWLGRMLLRREAEYFRTLAEVAGVPNYLEPFGANGFAREHVDGKNLREHFEFAGRRVSPDFFPRLQKIVETVHAKGIAHNDLAKPENVLVSESGEPALIDFQIAMMPKTWKFGVGWLFLPILGVMQRMDVYHFCKQYRRYAPGEIPDDIRKRGTRSGGVAGFHYHFIRRPYRAVRHFFLKRFFLVEKSPTDTSGDQMRKAA